jgi:hypothetical protein
MKLQKQEFREGPSFALQTPHDLNSSVLINFPSSYTHTHTLSLSLSLSLSRYSSCGLSQASRAEPKPTSSAPPVEEGGGDASAFFLSIVAVDLGFLLVVRVLLPGVEVQIDAVGSGF